MTGAPLAIEVAVAKLSKYAVRESGDTVEITERPHGGLSVVLADGQGSGRSAKTLSNLVAKKAINLLADGTRDGAAARAVHDFLHAYRHGQVSAELSIVSADLTTRSIVVSRNSHCPALLACDGEVDAWDDTVSPIGIYAYTKPLIRELPIEEGSMAVVYSDGIHEAGRRRLQKYDTVSAFRDLVRAGATVQAVADALLAGARTLDDDRPADDMTVVVVGVCANPAGDAARRLGMRFPLT